MTTNLRPVGTFPSIRVGALVEFDFDGITYAGEYAGRNTQAGTVAVIVDGKCERMHHNSPQARSIRIAN